MCNVSYFGLTPGDPRDSCQLTPERRIAVNNDDNQHLFKKFNNDFSNGLLEDLHKGNTR